MRAQSVRRITLALLFLALLAPAMAQALPLNLKATDGITGKQEKPVSWFEVIWQGLVRLWSGSTATGAGPGLDPNGDPTTPTSGTTPPGTGAGPGIDPDGAGNG